MGSKQQDTDLWSQQGYKWLVGVSFPHVSKIQFDLHVTRLSWPYKSI